MDTQPTTYVHTPSLFDAGDTDWVAAALAHLVPHLGLAQAWCLWVDVYSDDNGNFHPILGDPTLVVARTHALWATCKGKTPLTRLEGVQRLPALETLAMIVREGDAFIHLLEMHTHALPAQHDVALHRNRYWRVLLLPQGAVAIVPEDTDGYVERNGGAPNIGDLCWDESEVVALGCLGLPAPQSAHAALERHAKAKDAARWVEALCPHVYVGEAEGIVWRAPGHVLQP